MTDSSGEITTDLRDSSEALHQLFGTLFPSSTPEKTGARLQGLYFIIHQGPINWHEQKDQLYNEFNVGTRQGLHKTLKALEEQQLIIWNEGSIKATQHGHQTIESLQWFVNQYTGKGSREKPPEFDTPYYTHTTAKVYTNGDEYADYLWTWTLDNAGTDPIESIEYMCESGGSEIGELNITYSNTIRDHEITVDKSDTQYFELQFLEPVKPDETIHYWYSYRLPNNLHPDWGPFQFTYRCRTFPVATLELNIINDDRFNVDESSLRSRIELGDRSSIPSRTDQSGPRFEQMEELSYITYSAQYVPLGSTITLYWDFSYTQQ